MSTGSVRMHVPVDLHQHDDPPGAEPAALPGCGDDGAGEEVERHGARLWREGGKVLYQDAEMDAPEAVRVVWARPLSKRPGPASIMRAGKKREIAFIPDLSELPEESRRVALEELDACVVMPRILAVHEVKPRFGNYYWDVETDKGRRKFLLSSPENNTFHPSPDAIVIRDVSGNCYEIPRIAELSSASRREMDRVL
ncbi:MAG: DUF1854 domain-containing protein [Planctomycetota bacterium]|nr:DUF1854 domain-containing protein [Planctomycetota bacterium]